jgi:hypothetical protein
MQKQGGAEGYTRQEFNAIFQVYSREVYSGFFRDFSFGEVNGRYLMAFREQAGKTPLLTIEKRVIGPDRVLFSARDADAREVARSEKLDSFTRQLRLFIERVKAMREPGADKRVGYIG